MREYDIRGIYGEELNENTAYHIGRAFGTKLKELGKNEIYKRYLLDAGLKELRHDYGRLVYKDVK